MIDIGDRNSIQRYKSRSLQFRDSALKEMRDGHWSRVEDLLWGSLVAAIKAVALSRGYRLAADDELQRYTVALAEETRDRRMAEVFDQLSNFSAVSYRVQDSRMVLEQLYRVAERVIYTLEKLWELLPQEEEVQDG